MLDIRPIETSYKGYRFRSRLEARWALFLDTLGVKWEYEVEGYAFGGGQRYLPDFRISNSRIWLEVKGTEPNAAYFEKLETFCRQSGDQLILVVGTPSDLFTEQTQQMLDAAKSRAKAARFEYGETPR